MPRRAGVALITPPAFNPMPETLTPGIEALRAGQDALRYSWAPPQVTFRGEPVRALINDAPNQNWRDGSAGSGKAKVDLLPKGQTVITLFKDDLETDPKVGEYIRKNSTTQYRIQELHEFDALHWLCLCVSSAVT